jgi:hypothetical protein
MKNLVATAAVAGLLMSGTAYAAQTTLSDQQMDTVTAGASALAYGSFNDIVVVWPVVQSPLAAARVQGELERPFSPSAN